MGRAGLATHPALERPAQQLLASHSRGPLHLRGALVHRPWHFLEQLPRHQGGPRSLNTHGVGGFLGLAGLVPDGGARVCLVSQDLVERSHVPALAPVDDAPIVQLLALLLEAAFPQ